MIYEDSKPKEKLKAWYLFTDDFIAGTQHLTNEQVGVYIRLLCFNWNKKCVGLPSNNIELYRIANCYTDDEKQACNKIIKEFFVYVNDHYQNERQLQEFLYINKRIEASKVNGRLGGRPKKPKDNLDETPLPHTPTPTSTKTLRWKIDNQNLFNMFWDKIKNKVSKGIAEKNYIKLDEEWIDKPQVLAQMYNKYYDGIEDKQFAKQPAFWLSAKKYLDEKQVIKENEKVDQYDMRVKMFKEAIENKKGTSFIHKYAKAHSYDVSRAIKEGHFTKEEAIEFLDMEKWL